MSMHVVQRKVTLHVGSKGNSYNAATVYVDLCVLAPPATINNKQMFTPHGLGGLSTA